MCWRSIRFSGAIRASLRSIASARGQAILQRCYFRAQGENVHRNDRIALAFTLVLFIGLELTPAFYTALASVIPAVWLLHPLYVPLLVAVSTGTGVRIALSLSTNEDEGERVDQSDENPDESEQHGKRALTGDAADARAQRDR